MNQIAAIRKSIGVSQSGLAEKLNSVPSRIANFEASTRKPDIETCWEIVRALNELGADCCFEQVFPNPHSHSSDKRSS
ncbi:helix-turn-helix domain-containing protein [Vibrio fluvialis]|jgi:putative transcriptional regulator|uniref:helix-turn-helix domain-containing protein n=1 Tax=Vibrio fluvialis TaxID=676 RepID=UPI002A53E6B6|nr:helix-turn-helix transcriptional regulator [Vibrio fluvialis]EKO3529467.1 helix-turn-helix transcriptional regulator [Vibrio fluvialis]